MTMHPGGRTAARTATVALLLLAALAGPVAAATGETGDPAAAHAGHWEGEIQTPSVALGVKIDLAVDAHGAWTGTIDIPQQGAEGLALGGIEATADSLVFAIAGIPGEPTFRGEAAGDEVAGTFHQGGQQFAFQLDREVREAPARPQEPQPPFPYAAQEVGYEGDGVRLAATLTIPEGEGPFPAAILLTGSGAQDRDETILGHRPFLVLADHLTRQGIAVLRADDRGVGGSTGSTMQSTTSDFAGDALAGVRYLQGREEIDPDRIGLIGHSEGGMVAPLAASRAPDQIAYVVMLAGTGVPLGEVIALQVEQIAHAAGADSAVVADEVAKVRFMIDTVAAGADSAEASRRFTSFLRERTADRPADDRPDDQAIAGEVAATVRQFVTPWMRAALRLDPREFLREVDCPVLAVNGTLDLQVDPDQNLPAIEAALAAGGNPDATVRRLPDLNHLMQTATTGHASEYATIAETMSPVVLEMVSGWILARFADDVDPAQDRE